MKQMALDGRQARQRSPESFTCLVCGWEGELDDLRPVDGIAMGCPECMLVGTILMNEDLEDHDTDRSWHLRLSREIRELKGLPTPRRVQRFEAEWSEELGEVPA